jgi:hypothetical protein
MAARSAAAGPAGPESGGIEFSFEPVRQTVRAEVDARFAMSVPESAANPPPRPA